MNTKSIITIRSTVPTKFVVIFIYSIAACILLALPAIGSAMSCRVYCPDGSSVQQDCDSNNDPCGSSGSSGGSGNSGYDYEAARRAQEAAEAAAAEQQRQIEEARIEREHRAEEKRKKEAAAAEAFIRGRDATANTLRGSSDSAMSQLKGLAGADNSGLRGSSFDTGTQQKSAPASPAGDTSVVDTRNVPSDLPKAVDNAIAKAYSNAPPGVSDRVRKGFQAVTARDWKVARAWFEDALNRDPHNAGLKRLVALTYPPKQTAPAAGTQLQLPDPKDIWIMFPGLEEKTAPAVGTKLQLPDENDILLLFPGEYMTAPAVGTELQLPGPEDMMIIWGPEKHIAPDAGTQLQLPDPNDIYLTFPGLEVMDEKIAQDLLFGLDPQPPTLKSRKTK